jgi:uncharacterized protein (TIGR02266 family)
MDRSHVPKEASRSDVRDGADRRDHDRAPVTLFVEYDDATDFLGDFTENLSHGGTFVLTSRALAVDTEVKLALGFPGLVEPILLDAVIRWARGGDEPGIGVEFRDGPGRDRLSDIVARIERRDPRVVAARVIHILVAEDNPHMAELIRDGLSASARRTFGDTLAFTFSIVEHGGLARELLATTRFDAAIIDVYLPVIDGPKVIEYARRELDLRELPIIAVSAGGAAARSAALAAGANIFLDKPMRLRQVIDTMTQLMKLRVTAPATQSTSR